MKAKSNPIGDIVPWLVGGLLGAAAGAGAGYFLWGPGSVPASPGSPTFSASSATSTNVTQPVSTTVGASLLFVDAQGNAVTNVTSSPAGLLTPAGSPANGFVAAESGTATLSYTTSAGQTATQTVTIAAAAGTTTGTSGVPAVRPRKPPVAQIFGFHAPKTRRLAA